MIVVAGKARARSIASGNCGVVLPGFEAEAEGSELGEAFAKFGVAHQMRRDHAGGELLDRVIAVP